MILAFDIGNTNAAAALFSLGKRPLLVSYWKLRRPRSAGPSWWRELILMVCAEAGVGPGELEGCSVSSVVPGVSRVLAGALKRLTGKAPLMVRGGLPLGLHPAYAEPDRLGPDRVCAMLAGARKYGTPLIVVDCGTAITIDGVSRAGEHVGGMIAPGIAMSAAALGRSTAALPAAGWGVPLRPEGTDTVACIRSGVWFGAIGGIRESVGQLRARVGASAAVIGTGGDAPALMESAALFDRTDPSLVLEGAALAWEIVLGGTRRRTSPRGNNRRGKRPTSRRRGAKR